MKGKTIRLLLLVIAIPVIVLGTAMSSWATALTFWSYSEWSYFSNPQSSQASPIYFVYPQGQPVRVKWGADINDPNSLSPEASEMNYVTYTHMERHGELVDGAVFLIGQIGAQKGTILPDTGLDSVDFNLFMEYQLELDGFLVTWDELVFCPFPIAINETPDSIELTFPDSLPSAAFIYDQTLYTLNLFASAATFYADLYAEVGISPALGVSEPATMLLLASGLLGLAGFRRKFRKG